MRVVSISAIAAATPEPWRPAITLLVEQPETEQRG